MSTCLVTVRHADREWDLELPARVPAAALVRMLEEALGLAAEPALRLVLEPFGAVLRDSETLAGADVLDGARLLLTSEPAPAPAGTAMDPMGEGPALGWRPLGTAPAEETQGYTFKRLEE